MVQRPWIVPISGDDADDAHGRETSMRQLIRFTPDEVAELNATVNQETRLAGARLPILRAGPYPTWKRHRRRDQKRGDALRTSERRRGFQDDETNRMPLLMIALRQSFVFCLGLPGRSNRPAKFQRAAHGKEHTDCLSVSNQQHQGDRRNHSSKYRRHTCRPRIADAIPNGLPRNCATGRRENETGYLPPLNTKIDRIEQYDFVFLGFPTRGMRLPPPVKTFLHQYNLKGKTIIPFNTNGGYGVGSSFRDRQGIMSAEHDPAGLHHEGRIGDRWNNLVIKDAMAEVTQKKLIIG